MMRTSDIMQPTQTRPKNSSHLATPTFRLTEKQRQLNHCLAGPQRHSLLYGGSRSGKTFLFVRAIMLRALRAPGSRHAMLRLRGNAARASLWLDTLAQGAATRAFPRCGSKTSAPMDMSKYCPAVRRSGSPALDDKDRVEKILGNEYSTILLNECSQIPYQLGTDWR